MELSYFPLACCYLLLLIICSSCVLVVCRLFYSPIAHFPGPRLAAATFLYEFYYDVVRDGRYTWEIRRMHQQYGSWIYSVRFLLIAHVEFCSGPIVRINPYELHISDPHFYDQIYVGP